MYVWLVFCLCMLALWYADNLSGGVPHLSPHVRLDWLQPPPYDFKCILTRQTCDLRVTQMDNNIIHQREDLVETTEISQISSCISASNHNAMKCQSYFQILLNQASQRNPQKWKRACQREVPPLNHLPVWLTLLCTWPVIKEMGNGITFVSSLQWATSHFPAKHSRVPHQTVEPLSWAAAH